MFHCLHVSGLPQVASSVLSDEQIGQLLLRLGGQKQKLQGPPIIRRSGRQHQQVGGEDIKHVVHESVVEPHTEQNEQKERRAQDEEAEDTSCRVTTIRGTTSSGSLFTSSSAPDPQERGVTSEVRSSACASQPQEEDQTSSRTAPCSWQDLFELRVVRDRTCETTACSKGYAFLTFHSSTREEVEDFRERINVNSSWSTSSSSTKHIVESSVGEQNKSISSSTYSCSQLLDIKSTSTSSPLFSKDLTLTAQWSEPRTSEKRKEKRKKAEAEQYLPDLRVGRKKYPSKAKHADSVTCSDRSRYVMDKKGFMKITKNTAAI
ncbi:unnamed protein product [Amoebophrya sp. A25]|nr:unnamed protein product [Amoebophrya sp. A25]|eukprot:GSA25T00002650001.1